MLLGAVHLCNSIQNCATMATSHLNPALDFLTDAAHLLRDSAPEISAHLMSHRGQRLRSSGLTQSEKERQHVCAACGHIMTPGQGSLLRLEARKSIKGSRAGAKLPSIVTTATGPTKIATCGICHSDTRIILPSPGAASRHQKVKKPPTVKNEAENNQKPTANATSKKRTKNRKAGLQALLSSQQKQSKSLSLSDFMR